MPLKDRLHDLNSVDVVEKFGKVECKCFDQVSKVLRARVFEYEVE